jgi:AraC-like DNA-binding protein
LLERLPGSIFKVMSEPANDPFEDALSSLRIEGSVLLHGLHRSPWSVSVPDATDLRGFMQLGDDVRVIPFHLVLSGRLFVEPDAEAALPLHAGDVFLCPGGMAHRLFEGAAARTLAFEAVLRSLASHSHDRRAGAHGTELLCGAFALRAAPLNPLLAALPRVLVMQTQGSGSSPLLEKTAQLLKLALDRGDHGNYTTSRLLEILCAEAFRACGTRASRDQAGWFRALSDPRVTKALASFHRHPGAPWTVGALAREIAMSPSRFAARFREVTGQSVMSYVAAWRMNCACRELQAGRKPLGEIAAGVGYQDVAAFSRAFKALVGLSPARWRLVRRS